MNIESIPTIEDLTAEWFTELLRANQLLEPSQSVASVTVEAFGDEGNMSDVRRAQLSYGPGVAAADLPTTLVVKLAGQDMQQRFPAEMFKFYQREVTFYQDVQALTPLRTPRCYLSTQHLPEIDFVIVLEYFDGRRQISQMEGAGVDDAKIALTALADMHAAFWDKDLSAYEDCFLNFNTDLFHAVIPEVFKGYWEPIRDTMSAIWHPDVVALCDRFGDVVPQVLASMSAGPLTMCHGDYRTENLLYGPDGDLAVLDFQLVAISNGATDAAYFIGQSLTEEVAAEHGDALLDHYLARLAELGINFSRDEAMEPYHASLLFYMQIPMSLLGGPDSTDAMREFARTMLTRAGAEVLRTGAHKRFV
jgi:hypothetical protein